MLRRRFLTAAILAATALVVAPATSQAAFTVNIFIDNALVDTVNGTQDPITGLWSASKIQTYGTPADFVSIQLTAQSNQPGTPSSGYVLDTTTNISTGGTAGTQHEIKLVATAQPFTAPGAPGDKLFLQNILTSVGGTGVAGPNASNIDVYASVDPDNNPGTSNDVRTAAHSYTLSPTPPNPWVTPIVDFTRGSQFALSSVIDVTLAAGATAQVTTTGQVTPAPAPAGLVMIAGALPFAGLLRLRRRGAKVEATTAA